MIRHRFLHAVGFAALAALSLPLFVVVGQNVLGTAGALGLYAILTVAIHAMVFSPTPRKAMASLAIVLLGGFGVEWVLSHGHGSAGLWTLIVGLTALLGFTRATIHRDHVGLRSAFAEGVVGMLAIGLVALFAGSGFVSWSMACWGYFLAQAMFYLWPRPLFAAGASKGGDPFARAAARLDSLLAEVES